MFDLISLVWSHPVKEPIVNEDTSCALVADIAAKGVWQPQATTLSDIGVVDSDAPSYLQKPPITALKSAERENKLKYNSDCERRHASFTPLCVTIDGLLAPEMAQFVKHLDTRLSLKWDLNYSTVLYWVRSKQSISLVRATGLCIRGSQGQGLGFEDGADLMILCLMLFTYSILFCCNFSY